MLTNSSLLKNVFQPPVVASVSISNTHRHCEFLGVDILLIKIVVLSAVVGFGDRVCAYVERLIFEDHSLFFFLSDSLSLLG